MELIIEIVKSAKLENVREALFEMGIHGIASREVSGFAGQKRYKELYQEAEYAIDFRPKLKLASP